MTGTEPAAADWAALRTAWCEQPLAAVDWTALRGEVTRRSRRMAVTRVLELAAAAIAVMLCLTLALLPKAGWNDRATGLVLLAVALGFTGWTQWHRRRQWRALDLAPPALLAFEHGRTRTSLRIWRTSAWLSLTLWCGLYAAAWADLAFGLWGADPVRVWGINLAVNAVVVIVSAAIACGLGRRARARLRRLDDLAAAVATEDAGRGPDGA